MSDYDEAPLRAAIDIGTNTVLLLVARLHPNELEVVHEEQRIPRLGKDVDANRRLGTDGMDRVIEALNEYKHLIYRDYPTVGQIIVTATSAVRDAANRDEFLDRVARGTDLNVRVLSGLEEAEFTYRGAVVSLPELTLKDPVSVLDIGGGSTEMVYGRNQNLLDSYSFDIGSVRFKERYMKSDPPTREEIETCRSQIRDIFKTHSFEMEPGTAAIGVAGTVTCLATIDQGIDYYEASTVNGYEMSAGYLKEFIEKISTWSSAELLEKYPNTLKGRSDVFLTGLLILEQYMELYGFNTLHVSAGGIRHGALLHSRY